MKADQHCVFREFLKLQSGDPVMHPNVACRHVYATASAYCCATIYLREATYFLFISYTSINTSALYSNIVSIKHNQNLAPTHSTCHTTTTSPLPFGTLSEHLAIKERGLTDLLQVTPLLILLLPPMHNTLVSPSLARNSFVLLVGSDLGTLAEADAVVPAAASILVKGLTHRPAASKTKNTQKVRLEKRYHTAIAVVLDVMEAEGVATVIGTAALHPRTAWAVST